MRKFLAVGVCLLVFSICLSIPGVPKIVPDSGSSSIIIPKFIFRPVFEDRFVRFRRPCPSVAVKSV